MLIQLYTPRSKRDETRKQNVVAQTTYRNRTVQRSVGSHLLIPFVPHTSMSVTSVMVIVKTMRELTIHPTHCSQLGIPDIFMNSLIPVSFSDTIPPTIAGTRKTKAKVKTFEMAKAM